MKITAADEKISKCLAEKTSFLLDAGAGSGKTTSLIRALDEIRGVHRKALIANSQRVACITFTNVAKDEIIERTERDVLFSVSTIHEFLWAAIETFQPELKAAVIEFNEGLSAKSKRKKDSAELKLALSNVPVAYSDRGSNFIEGRLFHDDVLEIARIMFMRYPLLCRLVASRFPYIFVDEYQDTDGAVIKSLLEYVLPSKGKPLLGFFGDKMQSIYSDGVGELPDKDKAKLQSIQKEENYRCSIAVIDLLNGIRSDIKQVPAGDNVKGSAVYLNFSGVDSDNVVEHAKKVLREKLSWKFEDVDLRVLFLTHRLIARKAGYEKLFSAYNLSGGFRQEQFQSGKDPVAAFLSNDIALLLEKWSVGDEGAVISMLNKRRQVIASKKNKERVIAKLNKLQEITASNATIEAVLHFLRQEKLVPMLDRLVEVLDGKYGNGIDAERDEKEKAFYQSLLAVPFSEVQVYRAVLERNLPYSTKHGVKGDEFDTVLVVLDDAGANWSQYSFGNLLAGTDKSEDRMRRTRNLFYVSCSRAKRNLAVVNLGHNAASAEKIKALFGEKNCVL